MARDIVDLRAIDEGVDTRPLDEIDDILGKRNLRMSLTNLARMATLVDPVFGATRLGDEDYSKSSGRERATQDLLRRLPIHTLAYLALVALYRANPYQRADLTEAEFIRLVNCHNSYTPPVLTGEQMQQRTGSSCVQHSSSFRSNLLGGAG